MSNYKSSKTWVDWNNAEKEKVYEWLKAFKLQILEDGVLHFEDAYVLAEIFLERIPNIKILLQKRFQFVFVDEMQDMEKHQHDLLEKIFYCDDASDCIYQRIGDKNQAIFDGSGSLDEIWSSRRQTLLLKGSHRLSTLVAELVDCFAIHRDDGFKVIGLRDGNIRPHLLVYQPTSINKVIPKFSEIIFSFIKRGKIEDHKKNVFKVVAWRKEHHGENQIGLTDYFSDFRIEHHAPKIDYPCLSSYLSGKNSKGDFESIRKNIVNALLRILRYEDIVDPETNRNFTIDSLLRYLKRNDHLNYEVIELYIYRWSFGIVKGEKELILQEMQNYAANFLNIFGKAMENSRDFIKCSQENNLDGQVDKLAKPMNKYTYSDKTTGIEFDIEITTVHSEKGQDHTATLYLETYFQKDGTGDNAKSYESQRLSSQFKLNYLAGNEGNRVKQSAKMVYVGFSRPTHLLCVAVQKSSFDKYLSDIDINKWEIVFV